MFHKATCSDIQLVSCKATEHSFTINDKVYIPEALREPRNCDHPVPLSNCAGHNCDITSVAIFNQLLNIFNQKPEMAYPPDDELDMEGSPSTESSPQLSDPQPMIYQPTFGTSLI
ncbi:hypothetical protein K3495_g8904 [Podosphaera aphanis]|nr:hypothetical protein K3495_g8904 [Podosphaera aphanis]